MLAVALQSAVVYSAEDDNEKKREKTRKKGAETLQDLYKAEPPQLRRRSRSLPDTRFSITWEQTGYC